MTALAPAGAATAAGAALAILVSDVEMPELAGVALAVAAVAPGVPALLVSGRALREDAEPTLVGVRFALMPKPFSPDELDATLDVLETPAA